MHGMSRNKREYIHVHRENTGSETSLGHPSYDFIQSHQKIVRRLQGVERTATYLPSGVNNFQLILNSSQTNTLVKRILYKERAIT